MGNKIYRPYTHPLVQSNLNPSGKVTRTKQTHFANELQSALTTNLNDIHFQACKATARAKRDRH